MTKASPSRRGITLWPLIAATYFMVSGGPYGLEDVVRGGGYRGAILLLLLTPVFWSLPVALMIGELSSAIPAEGGYYVWVRRAVGPFWGFQEAWLSLAASIFDMAIYPTLFVSYLAAWFPGIDGGWRKIAVGSVVIAICVVWNLFGGRAVGESALASLLIMLGPFAILSIVALFRHGVTVSLAAASGEHFGLAAGLIVCMWNYMGFDNASNVGGEVEDPQRTYPLGMIVCLALIALGYVLPIAAVARAGIAPAQWQTGAWAAIGGAIAGKWIETAIVIGGMLAALSTFNSLMMSYSRLPLAMAEDRLAPRIFARVLPGSGAPWASILACAVLWSASLGLGFERLVTLDVILWGASLSLEFLALVALRVKEPELARPFRVPGNTAVAALLSVPPLALFVMAAVYGRHDRIVGINALLFCGFVIAAGVVVYGLAKKQQHHEADPAHLTDSGR
jgi:amino acid transporter